MKKLQHQAPKSFTEYLERIARMKEKRNNTPKGEVEDILDNSRFYREYVLKSDENIQQEYKNRLESVNLSLEFQTNTNLFVVKRINTNRKYTKTNGLIQQHLEIFLNNAINNCYILDILNQQQMTDEIKKVWLMNFYNWIMELDQLMVLYSIFKYKNLSYFNKALSAYNNQDSDFVNAGDTLKSVKSEVQPALTVQEQKAKIFNKQKSKKSKDHIKGQVDIYNSNKPFIITDPAYTPEQQTLIYTFIAIAQKKSMLPEFEESYQEYLKWYYKNVKNKNAELEAPIQGMTAHYNARDFFELMGLKLNGNTNDNKLIDNWMLKTLETLKNIDNQPFKIRYSKTEGNKGNKIHLYFKLDINTAPYILNLRGVQYEIIQGYFRAKQEVDKLPVSIKQLALYDLINFKVKTITEYKNPDYIEHNIEEYIKDKARTLERKKRKEFRKDALEISSIITIKNNNLFNK